MFKLERHYTRVPEIVKVHQDGGQRFTCLWQVRGQSHRAAEPQNNSVKTEVRGLPASGGSEDRGRRSVSGSEKGRANLSPNVHFALSPVEIALSG